MDQVAVSVHVVGRVQGVGYRYYCVAEAERLGVSGWVRNEPDGSVRGHFEGGRGVVEALVEWCRRGPSYAHVTHVATMPAVVSGATGFTVRY